MYLSCLLVDVGSNPDQPRPGRLWLRNLYRVHQRLCMAFPSASRKSDDEEFLKPFKPEDFGAGQVHAERGVGAGFLFRIDPQPGGGAMILVQSASEPDWDYAFHNAGYLLAAPWEAKPFDPCFTEGQRLRFRLLANPTKKTGTPSKEERESLSKKDEWKTRKGRNGKRVPVQFDKLYEWLTEKGAKAGFSITTDKESTVIQTGYIHFNKPKKDESGKEAKDKWERLLSVRYDGVLTVTGPDEFKKILVSGIGSGKAFGFGLLSVAPVGPSFPEEAT